MSAANLTHLECAVAVTVPFMARDCQGVEFTVDHVRWYAYPNFRSVVLYGAPTAGGERTNVTLFPDHDDVSHVPHPGEWFDHLAADVAAGGESR